MSVRVGLIGCGLIGAIHSYCLKALGEAGLVDARVVATHDTDPARADAFAGVHGARAAATADALLDAVDAVWVCTPTAAHRSLVEAAASRGVAVFCEKPLAPNLAEAEAVAAAARRAGVPVQVGLVLRTAPVFVALRDLLASGELGRPMTVVYRDDQFFPIQGFYGSAWRADVAIAGGGTLLEHSIHDLDILRWCLGDIVEVAARTANFAGHPGVEDVAVATLTFASGAHASLVSVWHDVVSRGSSRRVEVFCQRGLAWLDDDFSGPLHVETSAGAEARPCPPPAWVDGLGLTDGLLALAAREYVEADRAFLDALGARRPPSPGFADALVAHRVADAVYRSAGTKGAPVATRC